MGTRLTHRNPSGGTTDHAADVLAMRQFTGRIMAQFPAVQDCPDHLRQQATICEAAAALLEVHDDSGISLDDWIGPLQLVHEALWLIGKDRDAFIENGV